MKFKRSAVVLTAIMMMCASGCANSEKKENIDKSDKTEKSNSSVVTTTVASTVSMPEPIPVPEGGWTDETIKDVIYINGKNLQLPCTIDDLGDGFEIVPDKEADKKLEEKGFAAYFLKYNGIEVGVVIIKEDKIRVLTFDCSDYNDPTKIREDYPEIPFSVNGITIGTPISKVNDIMGEDILENTEIWHIIYDSDKCYLSMFQTDDKISYIKYRGINY